MPGEPWCKSLYKFFWKIRGDFGLSYVFKARHISSVGKQACSMSKELFKRK